MYNVSFGTSLFLGAIENSPVHRFDDEIPQPNYRQFVEKAGCSNDH